MSWHFEDFESHPEVIETPEQEITEAGVLDFARLSGDVNPLHVDPEYARSTPIGRQIAHGLLVLSVATGLSAQAGHLQGTALAFLGMEDWKFILPVFFGDRIRLRWHVSGTRLTSSGKAGVVHRRMDIVNQNDQIVQSGTFSTLVKCRAMGVGN